MYMILYTYMQALSLQKTAGLPSLQAPARHPRELLGVFLQLLPLAELLGLPSLAGRRFYKRIFCPALTLWYFIFQRIQSDHSLDNVLCDAHNGGADALHPELSKKLLSTATTSFSNARKRLPLAFFSDVLKLQARRITALGPDALWHGLLVGLLDGTTLRLRSLGDIPKHFPPHGNQSKTPAYWCLMRVVVDFCARTGTAMDCRLAPSTSSEQELACQMIPAQSSGPRLFIGDRNFGVFRVAQTALRSGSHALVRMTEGRARKLLKRPLSLGEHAVSWAHSRHDKLQPDLCADPIPGRLLVVKLQRNGFRTRRLFLFTTLTQTKLYPPLELARLYAVRWNVELNLRYLKTRMHLEQLECKSAEMAKKEWLAGLLAYNLVRASMLCAALRARVPALSLSFSSSCRHLLNWLARWSRILPRRAGDWEKLLCLIARARLPIRSKPRPAEPRTQRHLRQSFPPLIGSRADAKKKLIAPIHEC
jgi:hypothetical protein